MTMKTDDLVHSVVRRNNQLIHFIHINWRWCFAFYNPVFI